MAVRVRLLIRCGDKELETTALVNSGFETETPQLLLPVSAARRLGLWPPIQALEETYETAGGPAKVWVYPKCSQIRVLGAAASKEVETDIVVSPIEDEALISDKLAGGLEIIVEDFGRGIWRLRGEEKTHETERPQLWR